MGEIRIWGGNYAPKGWATCDGQLLQINQNQGLFALLGVRYGGNGQTTFALPDLRGRVPIGYGEVYTSTGMRGGQEAHTLIQSEMPLHTHAVSAVTTQADANTGNIPDVNSFPAGSVGNTVYGPAASPVAMSSQIVSTLGGSQPHTNMMPYTSMNFCIALQGIFPSRS